MGKCGILSFESIKSVILSFECGKLGFLFRIVSYLIGICRILIPAILVVFIAIDIAKLVVNNNLDQKVQKETTTKIVKRFLYALIIFFIPTIVTLIFKYVSNINPSGYGDENSATSWVDCFKQFFES